MQYHRAAAESIHGEYYYPGAQVMLDIDIMSWVSLHLFGIEYRSRWSLEWCEELAD
jgi:hypothetical protein